MIVPQFWAEFHIKDLSSGRVIHVRRYGWSDESLEVARTNAELRARDALTRILAGERLAKSDPKTAYNGAEGVPIREEIVSRRGDTIVTRNGYGALCLNTPNALFVDIDFGPDGSQSCLTLILGLLLIAALLVGILTWPGIYAVLALATAAALLIAAVVFELVKRTVRSRTGGPEARARALILKFIAVRPEWLLRVYRTPAGMRVLALHKLFEPTDPAVAECFRELGADPVYERMCLNQHCFRARVSPKPWRIGISTHVQPRVGVWPVHPERQLERMEWIRLYQQTAQNYAACRFVESLGNGIANPAAQAVQLLHDELSQALSTLPIA